MGVKKQFFDEGVDAAIKAMKELFSLDKDIREEVVKKLEALKSVEGMKR